MTYHPTFPPAPHRRAACVALLYVVVSALWIVLSDTALLWLAPDGADYAALQTWKGWFFVAVSGVALFLQLRWQFARLEGSRAVARQAAARLQWVLSSIDDFVFVVDAQGRFLECYQPGASGLPVPPGGFIGRRIDEAGLPAAVSEPLLAALATLRLSGAPQSVDYALGLAAGRRWFSARLAPMRDDAGAIAGAVVLVRDITAQKTSEQRLRGLLEDIGNIAVQGYDAERRVVFWNSASEALYGYTRAEALGQPLETLIVPVPQREQVVALHRAWLEHGRPIPAGELELLNKQGETVPVFSSHALMRNDRNEVEMYCVDIDLRALREARKQLRLAATVFESSGEAIMITDAANRVLAVNGAFTRITGFAPDDVVGREPAFFGAGGEDKDFYRRLWRDVRERGHWQGEIWSRRKNGERHAEWLGVSAVRDEDGRLTHHVAIFADIAEKKAIEARLEHLAHHDPLTGLPNRVLVRDRVEQALAAAAREGLSVALMFLDLDHFKVINDTLGHAVGDKLLQAVVGRLAACVRESDTISRQGGDEFLIVLPQLRDPDVVSGIAQKILDAMSPGFDIDGHALTCTFSIGVALHPEDGADFDTLLLKADTAMYHAKEAGRNTCRFFTEQMNADAHERLALQSHLYHAIERGELVLHYQPQVELASGRITGAEALLRWNCAALGAVSPARFIPVAEACGLIIPIGEWVLREACRQAEAWRQQGLTLLMAVNISALQFRRSDPVAVVSRILAETRLPAACLELELTESLLVQDAAGATLDTLTRLKALGVRIAIDDFGTGYSSLAYLRRFPIDKLKIDQAFVRDIATDPEDAAIVNLIIELGRILKLSTIAEGVEDPQQLAFLRERGCTKVQGYLFGRPIPAAQFLDHVRAAQGAAADAGRLTVCA